MEQSSQSSQAPQAPQTPLSDLVAFRRQKLQALRDLGVDPYGSAFETSGTVAEVREAFAEGKAVSLAGRITAYRDMGKSRFLDLSDIGGRMQVYLNGKELDEAAMAIAATFLLHRRPRAGAGFLAAAVLVMFSRVYLGIHFAGDVLAGAVTGSLAAVLVARLYRQGTPVDRLITGIL